MKTFADISVSGKKILVRCDLDVAMEDGAVREDFRLKAMIPTIETLTNEGAKVIILGHLGRPEKMGDPEFTLEPVIKRLAELLQKEITFVADWFTNPEAVNTASDNSPIIALENLRYDPREEDDDHEFSKILAQFGEIYVNEAFATAHRAHASTVGITAYLPSYLGLRHAQEIEVLLGVRENPSRPLVMIMGGGKAETKIPLVSGMSKYADTILVGGKLMFAKELEGIKGVRFPVDANRIDDIGPKTVEHFKKYIDGANMIVWNGPVGKYEDEAFRYGTQAVAEIVAQSTAQKIIGGGDTVAALDLFGMLDKMDFVSTGGRNA